MESYILDRRGEFANDYYECIPKINPLSGTELIHEGSHGESKACKGLYCEFYKNKFDNV